MFARTQAAATAQPPNSSSLLQPAPAVGADGRAMVQAPNNGASNVARMTTAQARSFERTRGGRTIISDTLTKYPIMLHRYFIFRRKNKTMFWVDY